MTPTVSTSRRRLSLEQLERRDVPSFAAPPAYPVGLSAVDMAHGDFNNDGRMDIAVANKLTPGKVNVLMNAGDGNFETAKSFPSGGVHTNSIAVGDMNGDGKLDIVLTNDVNETVSLLRGSGTGMFRRPITFSSGPNPSDIAVGDFNADGNLDMAISNEVANGQTGLSVLFGTGGGGFQPTQGYVIGTRGRATVTGDVNNDGADDILVVGFTALANQCGVSSPTISVLTGLNGTLQNVAGYLAEAPGDITLADLNGDGNLDFIVANTHFFSTSCASDTIEIRLGNGDGTFQNSTSLLVGTRPLSVGAGDVNGDGKIDLAVTIASTFNQTVVLPGNGNGTFQPLITLYAGVMPLTVIPTDFTGDSIGDLAVLNGNTSVTDYFSTVSLISGSAAGTFNTAPSYETGRNPNGIAAADLNGDGLPDLVTSNRPSSPPNPSVNVLINAGSGVFLPAVSYPAGSGPQDLTLGDVNGDGIPDILAAEANVDGVTVLLGNGDGTFKPAVIYLTGGNANAIVAADFNGDGVLDSAVTHTNSTIGIVLGSGDGSFYPFATYPTVSAVFDIVTADFDEDGFPDLASSNANPSKMSVYLNRGDASFLPHVDYSTGGSKALAAGDVTGDGHIDLVVENGTGIDIFPGNGDGTFASPISHVIGQQHDVQVGHLNSDGRLDIVAVSQHHKATMMLSNDDGTFSLLVYLAGSKPDMVTVADFDGDGMSDVAVGNPVDLVSQGPGHVSILLNTSGALPITPPPAGIPDGGDVLPSSSTGNKYSPTLRSIEVETTTNVEHPTQSSRTILRRVDFQSPDLMFALD